jgi:hypothetical protein
MTILRSIAAPSLALRRPCCPIDLTIPDLPKGAKGLGLGGQRQCWSTPSDPIAAPRDPIDLGGPHLPDGPDGGLGFGVMPFGDFSRPSRLR